MTARDPLRHSSRRRHDHPPALDARRTVIGSGAVFLDGTIVNVGAQAHRPGAARRRSSASSRARPTSSAATSRSSPRCSSSPARCPTTTAGAGSTPSAWSGSRRPPPCAAWPRRSSGWSSSASLQGAAGALLIPGSLALITHAFDGVARARAFGIWAASTAALTIFGPIVGGTLVDTVGWRVAFLINVPLLAFALWATLTPRPGIARHGDRPAGSTGSGRSSRRWPSAAWRSGSSAARPTNGRTRRPGSPSRSASCRSIAFPILMARRPHPLVPLELFRIAGVRVDQPRDVLHLRRPVRDVLLPGRDPPGRPRLHGARGRADRPAVAGSCWPSCRPGSARWPAGYGSRRFLIAGPLLMATGLLWLARLPADSAPWTAVDRGPGQPHPADRSR